MMSACVLALIKHFKHILSIVMILATIIIEENFGLQYLGNCVWSGLKIGNEHNIHVIFFV